MTIYTMIDSPLGELLLVGEYSAGAPGGVALTSLSMPDQRGRVRVHADWEHDDAAFWEITRQIGVYFAGEPMDFDLEYQTHGTEFQEKVWQAVGKIPYGSTTTYGELAETIGVPRSEAVRIGAAVGANPLLLVRPCHRVIGADGSMKGYAAGIERKELLLRLEGFWPALLV